MEVMHRAVVKNRALKPLPSEITNQRINGAILPVHIESARHALALCTTLDVWKPYAEKVEMLAAAVRTMKEVGPEMIRNANEMMADAWRKGGELLSQYNNVARGLGTKIIEGKQQSMGALVSDRIKIGTSLGLRAQQVSALVRFSAAPRPAAYVAITKSKNLENAARWLSPGTPRASGRKSFSNALRRTLGAPNNGLTDMLSTARRIPLEAFAQLTLDERKVVKAKIIEIMELLDEMDRLCK